MEPRLHSLYFSMRPPSMIRPRFAPSKGAKGEACVFRCCRMQYAYHTDAQPPYRHAVSLVHNISTSPLLALSPFPLFLFRRVSVLVRCQYGTRTLQG